MGRIHRIGQEQDVYILTCCREYRRRVLEKLQSWRNSQAMGDRVFDVIGQLLQLNDIRFEEMVREATYTKAAADEVLEQIENLTPNA